VNDRFEHSVEVREALAARRAVVALETSVLAQGLPDPWNRTAAETMDRAARAAGAIPAWTWIGDGRVRLGADPSDLDRLMAAPVVKVARRDVPPVVASGAVGGTTVSATVWAAHHGGVDVAATGGIGGVHPGTGDVSADLLELSRVPGTLVCSGPKSILDPAATVERLEELGVGLLGYRTDRLPFFIVQETALPLEHRADDPAEVAAVARVRREMGIESVLLVCNPCPPAQALDPDRVEEAVRRCVDGTGRVAGKDLTPRLLACLAEATGGDSLRANVALLESNAGLAGRVAAALS
jgi:pseudouridine-5'-phosphate glycosidase